MTTYPLIHPFTAMAAAPPPLIVKAMGARLTDADGKSYLDGVASLWNINLGHDNQDIKNAIRDQLDHVDYTTLFGLAHEPAVDYAQLLTSALPASLNRVHLVSGGSEAVETALKLAMALSRARHGRETVPHIVHLEKAYHGVSLGALSAMGMADNRALFEPLLSNFHAAASPYLYRHPEAPDAARVAKACAEDIDRVITRVLASSPAARVAAVLVEPVQGAGGIITPPEGYLRLVREICDARGVPLIVDEVATGFWRTGKLFAIEHEGVVPDLLTFGKASSGGYLPLGGVVVGDDVFDALGEFFGGSSLPHGFTFGGSPLACAAGVAAMRQYLAPGFGERVSATTAQLSRLAGPVGELATVGDVRQAGLMIGFELVEDRATRRPFPPEADIVRRVVREAREQGLVIRPVGSNTAPLMPPLTATDDELTEMVGALGKAIDTVTSAALG
ncbi:adenosylmethionine-8-amino-7-oxononanoate aminotransferase [Actinokineospora baliensis]|uniref:aminotransferase family protein n=1 Tax=Actinokineospora baliensis TaxID=547056 RepID=UPI001958F754|nr:aspartate aminotransferase family protein [Actinokineospora baliensis]MBM7775519.1 adenosylmethionine-8-amino-7-oxononanoate aminotransferase [Actinokineospora baliensis]